MPREASRPAAGQDRQPELSYDAHRPGRAKGEGKVIAVIDTGVDTTHQALTGCSRECLALNPAELRSPRSSQLGEGKTGAHIRRSSPSPTTMRTDNDASPREGGLRFPWYARRRHRRG